ncbi:unnamed protein product [Rhizophagus irregularis]|nr:unnamed protein product [Rhizophagus irregularis]
MDTSKQNTNIIENNSKTGAKNLWKSVESEYQFHATIFSTESDETSFIFKKRWFRNDFLNEIKYYISEPVNSIDYLSSFQEPISSSVNPISERLDCELSELNLNQDDE